MMTFITQSGTRYSVTEVRGWLPWAEGVSPVVDLHAERADNYDDAPDGVYRDAIILSNITVGEKVRFKAGDEVWITSRVSLIQYSI